MLKNRVCHIYARIQDSNYVWLSLVIGEEKEVKWSFNEF